MNITCIIVKHFGSYNCGGHFTFEIIICWMGSFLISSACNWLHNGTIPNNKLHLTVMNCHFTHFPRLQHLIFHHHGTPNETAHTRTLTTLTTLGKHLQSTVHPFSPEARSLHHLIGLHASRDFTPCSDCLLPRT